MNVRKFFRETRREGDVRRDRGDERSSKLVRGETGTGDRRSARDFDRSDEASARRDETRVVGNIQRNFLYHYYYYCENDENREV